MARQDGYESNADLPPEVSSALDQDSQDVYRIAYNNALASGAHPAGAAQAGNDAVARGRESGKLKGVR